MESYTEYVFSKDLRNLAKEFSNSLKKNGNLWAGKYNVDKRKTFLREMKRTYAHVVSSFKGQDFLGFKFKPVCKEICLLEKSYIANVYIKTEPVIFVLKLIFDTHPLLFNQNHIVLFETNIGNYLYYDTELFSFHTPDGREKLNSASSRLAALKTWKSKNHSFYSDLDQFYFEIQKGSWGPEDYIDSRFIASRLKEDKLQHTFYAEDVYQDWQKTEFGKYFDEDDDEDTSKFCLRLTNDYFEYSNNIVVFVGDDENTGRTYRFRFKFDNGYGCLVCESGVKEKPFSIVPIYYKSNGAYHVETPILNLRRNSIHVPITKSQVKKVLEYIKSLPTRFTYTLNKDTFECDNFFEENDYDQGDPVFRWTIKTKHSTISISYTVGAYMCNDDSFIVSLDDKDHNASDSDARDTMSLAKAREYVEQIKVRESNKFVLNNYF